MTNAQDTTPARAEAQDEGTAGEIERLMTLAAEANDDGELDQAMRLVQQADALYAHPSPTPTADADRVRIADADAKWLVRWLGDQKEGGHCGEGNVERRERAIWNDRIDRILGALKSEGK